MTGVWDSEAFALLVAGGGFPSATIEPTGGGFRLQGFTASFGTGAIPYTPPFQITTLTYDSVADTFRCTWNSEPGATYTLRWSPDLVDWGADISDDIESQGATTTFPPTGLPAEPNPNAPNGELFLRIEKNP